MENFPKVLPGGLAIDDRGVLSYLNVAPLEKVVRLYMVENFSTDTIRAFHGHKIEEKMVLVVSGSAIVVLAKMREKEDTSSCRGECGGEPCQCHVRKWELEGPTRHVLSGLSPRLLQIPSGYASGFRGLEPNTKILFFSSTTIDQAETDDYRFPADILGDNYNWIWKVENR